MGCRAGMRGLRAGRKGGSKGVITRAANDRGHAPSLSTAFHCIKVRHDAQVVPGAHLALRSHRKVHLSGVPRSVLNNTGVPAPGRRGEGAAQGPLERTLLPGWDPWRTLGEQRAGQGFRLPVRLPRCVGVSGVPGCRPAAPRPAVSVPALPYPDAVNPRAALVSLNQSRLDEEGIFRLFCRVA